MGTWEGRAEGREGESTEELESEGIWDQRGDEMAEALGLWC